MRAVCVAGARPNFMKIKPVMDALEDRDVDVVLVHTGQHYDALMNDVFFSDLGIRTPDRSLEAGSGGHAVQTARVMVAFEAVVGDVCPDVVVVVGDVNSTMACAIVAAKSGALVAHVEAGLRSRDWTMPEEVNRVVTDRVSDLLLAPSDDAVANLYGEGYRSDQVHLVGNVMVDSLLTNLPRALARPTLKELGLDGVDYGLVTLHRPANVDDPDSLVDLARALNETAALLPLVFPVHPRTARALTAADLHERVKLLPPAGYLDFIALEARARLVLTDSGGVQEETTVLGVPCLTLRDNTERPATVIQGTNSVVGRDPARIVAAARMSLADPPPARCPALWDGHAGDRIADVVIRACCDPSPPRPTARFSSRCDSPRPHVTEAVSVSLLPALLD